MDKSRIYGISLTASSLLWVLVLTMWLFGIGSNDNAQANRETGIRLSIETPSTNSVTILTHGVVSKDGTVIWGEIYVSEPGYVAVESIRLPLPPEPPVVSTKEEK